MADPDVDWEGDLSEGEEEELDDDEWEEETTYVVLDLGPNFAEGNLLEEAIARNGTYQLVGLDRANPFLRIGTAYFKGERVETIGTDLVFAAENHPGPASAPAAGAQRQSQGWRRITSRPPVPPPGSFQPPPPQQRKEPTLVCKTTKRIMFQQVKLSLKGEEAGEAAASGEAPQANGPEVEPVASAPNPSEPGIPAENDEAAGSAPEERLGEEDVVMADAADADRPPPAAPASDHAAMDEDLAEGTASAADTPTASSKGTPATKRGRRRK